MHHRGLPQAGFKNHRWRHRQWSILAMNTLATCQRFPGARVHVSNGFDRGRSGGEIEVLLGPRHTLPRSKVYSGPRSIAHRVTLPTLPRHHCGMPGRLQRIEPLERKSWYPKHRKAT